MIHFIHQLNSNQIQWIAILFAALLTGFSKTGIGGTNMVVIPILASLFGGRRSTGILLPMLLAGDILSVSYYHKNVQWKNVRRPLPWALTGLVLGAAVGNFISEKAFILLIGMIVLFCLTLLIYTEKKGKNFIVPNAPWFYITAGILSGFTSMIGNAAGPVFSIYLLSLGLKKKNYMGTNAWFFLFINLCKVPLQVFAWNNITLQSLQFLLISFPIIILGGIIGIIFIKKIQEKHFRYVVILMTGIAALKLFFIR